MDRAPKPAPFKAGTKVRYCGPDRSWTEVTDANGERKMVPLIEPGIIVTVAETRAGRRGTLVHLRDDDGPLYYEDTGEPILDTTRDGYSIYRIAGAQWGRCIDPKSAKEWEAV